jgi:predicted AAA+ superfamily ATPase
MYKRNQNLGGRERESCFLWGARQTGKSTLLAELFPSAPRYDLLQSDQYARLAARPELLREELTATPPRPGEVVVIDEVQKVPALLDEVHWLIENRKISFVLCGSSARKLKRGGANLLGGRALRYELHPLASAEVDDFDLLRAVNHGLLPRHYLAERPQRMLAAYVGDYVKEEIAAEALTRNIPAFARFLEAAAFSNGEIVNFHNIGRECGVTGPTVKAYFEILEDTLMGRFVPAYRRKAKRRVIESPRFYYFDVGVANHLLKRGKIEQGGESFGKAFEHLIFQELVAHRHYSGVDYELAYWRTTSGLEVDFVLGEGDAAIEVKSTERAEAHHFRGLSAFAEEHRVKRSILVTLDPRPRETGGVLILPWRTFLERLWSGKIIA